MSRPYHHGDLRAALLALAEAHVAREGVETLSVRALAREAGVAHRAAYQHFPDRDHLIAAVLTAGYERLAARLATDASMSDTDQRLLAVAATYAEFARDEPQIFLAMNGPRVNAGGVHKALETAIARCWRDIAGPIGAGVDAGLYRTADKTRAAALFWGGLVGVLTQAALGRLKLKPAERDAFVRDVTLRLLAGLKAAVKDR